MTKSYEAGLATRNAAISAKKTAVRSTKAVASTVADFFRGMRAVGTQPSTRKAR